MKEHPVLLTEALLNPKANHEILAKIVVDSYFKSITKRAKSDDKLIYNSKEDIQNFTLPMDSEPSASSGMGVADHCKGTFLELQRKKAHRYVIFKINENKNEVVVDKTGSPSESYEDFTSALPENDCRYAVYDFDFVPATALPHLFIFDNILLQVVPPLPIKPHLAKRNLSTASLFADIVT
ncbi:Actin-binding, cofilin/tropomyosin type [Artemisia annua]|uniref:Actin-binding, cofilin/tropomyosin type n=1 Tax=Artemisia annua TaxID=35608 RepID=A0A2U1N1H3_ARTAN|nr:Actin-binding, cofilin/tropomyosin type [Artemisia annua]